MINRQIAPGINLPEKITIPVPENIGTQEMPIYIFSLGTQEVVKIELIFNAGTRFHQLPLIPSVANEMIDEGTSLKTSAQIAGLFDYYGASVQTECTPDHASVILYTLTKFLRQTLSLLVEIINDPIFPDKEMLTHVQQEKQSLTISLEKVSYLVRKHFNSTLYPNHYYGYFPQPDDFDELKREDVISFVNEQYHQGLNAIIISGLVKDETKGELLNILQQLTARKKYESVQNNLPEKQAPVNKFVEKADAVQNAIRVGKRLFNRTHPDYPKLTVLNTILGGYFGSRLMSNIREDKGYTYGIGSGLVSLANDGYLYIATEVGSDVSEPAVKEIFNEIRLLTENPVPEDELTLVRNYLWGSFQRSIDGPFAVSERFKTILLSGLDEAYYYRYLDTVKSITSKDLLALAQSYLAPSEMTTVIVGKK